MTKLITNNIIYLSRIEGGNLKYKYWLANILSIVREAANSKSKSGLMIIIMIIVILILIFYVINQNKKN